MVMTDMTTDDSRNLSDMQADLASHHIEGIARMGNTGFSCPLITRVEDDLWQGGCRNGANLHGYFKNIISLYPWERFNPGGELDSFTEVRLLDGPTIPNEKQLYTLAAWINICRKNGRTLVHCQAGLNRSGLLTGLSLILKGFEPKDAITLLRASRSPAVLCNQSFEQWLMGLQRYGQKIGASILRNDS